MKLASIYFFIVVLIGRKGLNSIRFEQYRGKSKVPLVLAGVRFYGFNEVDCHHIGWNCSATEECCGSSYCALPSSWSSTKVCLLPGFNDEQTLKAAANVPAPTEVYNGINTIEDILTSVKKLSDKLNQLTYEGRELKTYPDSSWNLKPHIVSTLADSSTKGSLLPSSTMEPTVASQKRRKISKWNVVKALFLRTRTNKTLASAEKTNIIDKPIIATNGLKVLNAEKGGGVDMPDKFSILKIFGSFHTKKSTQNPKGLVQEVPDNVNDIDEKINGEDNTENIIMKQRGLNNPKNNADISQEEVENDLKQVLFSGEESDMEIAHQTHFDNEQNNTFYLVHDTNSIANILDSFRNWFSTSSHDLQTKNKNYIRNESTSTTPSSVSPNKASNLAGLQTHLDVIDTDYNDHSDSSVEYSENKEGLYNNSYVFIIKHKNVTDNKSETKWKSLVHFLHSVKLNPYHRVPEISALTTAMSSEKIATNASHLVEVLSNISSKFFTPNITIRIPENLMPEALEAEQPDLDELLFSSNSYEEYGELNT